jgi:hypothetical protein
VRKEGDQLFTETLEWHVEMVAMPLVLDIAAMFAEALG